ncbi:MAG: hypothetical protein HY232_15580 [Acidobacteria bacterium]|nr:hypothetical protein [Acidobacteriota bacterium]
MIEFKYPLPEHCLINSVEGRVALNLVSVRGVATVVAVREDANNRNESYWRGRLNGEILYNFRR